MGTKGVKILITITFAMLFFCMAFLVSCKPTSKPPGNNVTPPPVVDSWYQIGYTKGSVEEKDFFNDLVSSLMNQTKEMSDPAKLNDTNPKFGAEANLLIKINNIPARAELLLNWDIKDRSKRAARITVFKGVGASEEKFVELVFHEAIENKLDFYITIKSASGYTRLVSSYDSSKIATAFPLNLDSFHSLLNSMPTLLDSVVKTNKIIKYEFREAANKLTRRYSFVIDLKGTIESLVEYLELGKMKAESNTDPAKLKDNISFFIDNLIGTDSRTKETVSNSMPPSELTIELVTENIIGARFNSQTGKISKLNLKLDVQRDIKTENNTRFRGQSYAAQIDITKFLIGKINLIDKIPKLSELEETNDISEMKNGKFYRYTPCADISILIRGKYKGNFADSETKEGFFTFGLKLDAACTGGDNEAFYFKIHNESDEIEYFKFKYSEKNINISGEKLQEAVSIPFDARAFITQLKEFREDNSAGIITNEKRMFKIVTFLIGALNILDESVVKDKIIFDIDPKYLYTVMGVNKQELKNALQAAYMDTGDIEQELSKWMTIDEILVADKFTLEIHLMKEYLEIMDSLPQHFEG